MEISYVQPGEKITAQGYNALVDAVGGAGNYSAEGFLNEKNGTTLWNRANLSMKYFNGAWRTMFQVVEATYWKQTARGQWNPPDKTKTLLIDLGSDADALKANVTVMGEQVENAAVIVGDSPSMDAQINDALYKNASGKKAQWIDLGINPEYTSFIAGDFFKEVKEEGEGENKKKVTKYYFAVTDKSKNDVINRAYHIFGILGEFKLIKRFILSKKGDASIGSDIKNYVQAHTGVLSYSTPTPDMISVDSNISNLMLSSLEILSVEYQISGISGDVKTEVGDVYSFWNFEKPLRISLKEALDKEKSDNLNAPSCRVDVVLRIGKADNSVSAPTMVDYLELSTLVVSCDTDFYNKQPKEINSTSIERTSAEKGQPALQLKGFKDEAQSGVPDKYDLIVRETNEDKEKVLKYIAPADLFLVDNDISSLNRNSLEKQTDPNDADKKFVQLYNFDDPGYTVISVDKYTNNLPEGYKLVVRHDKSVEGGNVEVEYCDLSIDVLYMSADSDFPDEQLSSLERRENTLNDPDYPEKKLTIQEFSMYKFNLADYKMSRSEILDDSTVLMREKLTGGQTILRYVDLSSFEESISGDVDIDLSGQTQKSIDFKHTVNDPKQKYAQLYNFDSTTADVTIDLKNKEASGEKYHFLVKKVSDGKLNELQYADVSAVLSTEVDDKSIEVNTENLKLQLYNFDSTTADVTIDLKNQELSGEKYHFLVKKVSDGKLNELQYADVSAVLSAEVDDKSIEVNAQNQKLQLKYFDQDSYNNITLSGGQWFDLSGKQCLVGKNLETGELNYYSFKVDLSANQLCADTRVIQDGNYDTQSIDEAYSLQDKVHYHRLHNFDLDSALEKNLWEDTMHVLVRQKDQSNLTLEYIKLTDLSGLQLSADSLILNSTNSLDVYYSQEKLANVIKINGFDDKLNEEVNVVSADADRYDVLMRHHTAGGAIDTAYLNVAALLSTNVQLSCDSQGTTNKKSIAYNTAGELELYNFDKITTDLTVSHSPAGYTPDTQLILVKNINNGQLQYARLYTNTRTDTSCDNYSNSIEYSGQYNAIKINGWNTKANTAASTVSANAGNYDVLMRRHNGSYYYTEYMNIAPLLSGGAQTQGETTDLTVITQVVWDTSTHKIQPKGKKLSFVNGLLSTVSETEFNVGGINTTPWTGE